MVASIAARDTLASTMGIDYGKIRALRERLKLSQDEAALAAGFKSRQAWNNYECGRKVPRVVTLEKIAAALGVKAKDLLK
jgi:transcriptional regulator with XRE-family HTH domain